MSGWQRSNPDVFQALKEQKVLLALHTPNKAAVAEIIGVRASTVERWCDVTTQNPNFPLALVSLHPAARQLLESHAYRIGYTLVPLDKKHRHDGQLDDELRASMANLGKVAETVQTALNGLQTPGEIDPDEAREIRQFVGDLQRDLVQMTGELDGIIEGGDAS